MMVNGLREIMKECQNYSATVKDTSQTLLEPKHQKNVQKAVIIIHKYSVLILIGVQNQTNNNTVTSSFTMLFLLRDSQMTVALNCQ